MLRVISSSSRLTRGLIGLTILCSSVGLRAQQPALAAIPQVPIETYRLPNGLRVILHVDRSLPIVHVNQWFEVGWGHERPDRHGFAHFFEHMMFQGSVNAPGEFFVRAQDAGADVVDPATGVASGVNGSSNVDYTNYYATVPSGNLEHLLWLESDRLATLPEAITQASLDNQRMVVANEIRQRYLDRAFGRTGDLIAAHLYPDGHPYHRGGVSQAEQGLADATLDEVREFFRLYYTPNNLSLVIAGDFDPATAKRLVVKYFGSLPPGPSLDRPARTTYALTAEKVIEVKERAPVDRTFIAWHSPAFFEAGDADLDLAGTILAAGVSSRLQRALIHRDSPATAVSASQASRMYGSYFAIAVTTAAGADLTRMEQRVSEEIARLATEGPTAGELEQAKARWEASFLTPLETLLGKANMFNNYNLLIGDPHRLEWDLNRYRRATTEDVRSAVHRYLNNRQRVIVRFRAEAVRADPDAIVDRTVVPPFGVDRPFVAPAVETATLENGLTVLVVNKPTLPKVVVALNTRAGTIAEPANKLGLALLTNRAMLRGTTSLDAEQLASAFGAFGTSLQVVEPMAIERRGLTFEVLKRHLGASLRLLADVTLRPAFAADQFDREQQQALRTLARDSSSADATSIRVSSLLAYGEGHPYGRDATGVRATVEKLTRDDAVAFHRQYWRPGSTGIVFVGDVTLAEALALTREHFGAWTGGAAVRPAIPAAHPNASGRIFLIDHPGAASTIVTQILTAPARRSAATPALSFVNQIYGGSTFSRLGLNLREDKGYSYGANSHLEQFATGGAWYAFGAVQTDKTREAVVEFFKEMKGVAGEKPISETEFATSRTNQGRRYAQQFESFSRVERKVSDLWVAGLPTTHLQDEWDMLGRLTMPAANAVAQQFAAPSKASLLLMGDLSKIEAGIRSLNQGEVVILDRSGNVVGPTRFRP